MIKNTVKQLDALQRLKNELNVTALPKEVNRWADDKNKQERFGLWLKNLQKDIYLDQTVKVINDIIGQQNLVKGKPVNEIDKKAF